MNYIEELIEKIRGHINIEWGAFVFDDNDPFYFQLSSALDTICDTEWAIKAYKRNRAKSKSTLYLHIYGLLQALFLQQDALRHLYEALLKQDINIENIPELSKIRGIRTRSIGHPTKQGHNKNPNYHFISQNTLERTGFTLLSFSVNSMGQYMNKFEHVSIPTLIQAQSKALTSLLKDLEEALETRNKEHKLKFAQEKLSPCFHSISYPLSKLSLATSSHASRGDKVKGKIAVDSLRDVINKFSKAVERRNRVNYNRLLEANTRLNFALNSLEIYLDETQSRQPADQLTADIFACYVINQIESLERYAEQIDEYYAAVDQIRNDSDATLNTKIQVSVEISPAGHVNFTPPPEEWANFVNATYGVLADDPIERSIELPVDDREDIE